MIDKEIQKTDPVILPGLFLMDNMSVYEAEIVFSSSNASKAPASALSLVE